MALPTINEIAANRSITNPIPAEIHAIQFNDFISSNLS